MSDPKHITEQRWSVRQSGSDLDEISIVGEDGTVVAKIVRPDLSGSLLVAGYIVGLQHRSARLVSEIVSEMLPRPPKPPRQPPAHDPRDHDERCVPSRMYSVWHCHPDCAERLNGAGKKS